MRHNSSDSFQGTVNKITLTPPTNGATLTLADGKTLAVDNSLTLSGTDASTLNIGTGGTLGTAAYTASTAYDASGAATTAVSNHAALQTGVHGISITAAKTLTVSNSLTLAGTDGNSLTIGASASVAGSNTGDVTLATNHGLALTNQVIGMGTPSSITDTSTNAVTTTTHTHAITGFEVTSNKSNNIATDAASTTKYPSVKAIKDYADGLVVGLLDYRGGYDASVNTYPTTGGSGSAGAVLKGDMYVISVGGTLSGVAIQVGDMIIATVDTPGQTAGNWNTLNTNISYVAEDVANKVTSLSGASTNTQYTGAKLVYDQLALKANLISPAFTTPSLGVATATSINGATITSGTLNGSVTGTNTGDVTLTVNSGMALTGQALNMGTPSTITSATTNSVTTTTHTHALTVTKSDVGLGSVENTALSTWAGTANVITLGTVTTGTWNAATIADGKIATALTGKTYNALTLTALATGFSIAGGTTSKTLTVSNTLTLAGTDGTTMTFPTTSATLARTDAANTFTGHQTIEGVTSTGATGTGNLVFNGTPTLLTPVFTGLPTGTGVSSTATASTLVARDVNGMTTAAGRITSVTSTATAAGTTTLTSSSNYYREFTGTTTQTLVLPNATTLSVGAEYKIFNNSTGGSITINVNGGTLLLTLTSGSVATLLLTSNGSTAGTWDTTVNIPVYSNEVYSAATFTGTGADALVTGMAITPPAGIYKVFFEAPCDSTVAGGVNATLTIRAGGVANTNSTRALMLRTAARGSITTAAIVTVNGSQVIDVYVNAPNTVSVYNRRLEVIRIE